MADFDETADLDAIGPDLAKGLEPQISPPVQLRERLLARISGEPQGFGFVAAGEGEWVRPVRGVRLKVLSHDPGRGYATVLLEGEPGTEFPGHFHPSAEHCYVLSGDFIVCGRKLGAGDFHHADAGTTHPPSRTEGGCTLLLVAAAENYLP